MEKKHQTCISNTTRNMDWLYEALRAITTLVMQSFGHLIIHSTYSEWHRWIDPLDFDRKCDQSLRLEEMISYNPQVRKLFEDIDKSRVRVWALTNAYRVVSFSVSRSDHKFKCRHNTACRTSSSHFETHRPHWRPRVLRLFTQRLFM